MCFASLSTSLRQGCAIYGYKHRAWWQCFRKCWLWPLPACQCRLWPHRTGGHVTLPVRLSDTSNIVCRLFKVTDTAEQAAIGNCCFATKCAGQNVIDFAFAGFEHGRTFFTLAVRTSDERPYQNRVLLWPPVLLR